MKTIIILAFLSGCAGSYSKIDFSMIGDAPPNADQVIAVIAYDYGLKFQPNVYWYGKNFNCPGHSYWWIPSGHNFCVDGAFNDWSQDIAVSNYGMTIPIHQTALAHELCHQREWEQNGDSDSDHVGECFQPNGIVDKENLKLASVEF